jgi:DNA-binding NarL/FixJ family response regulator
MLMINRNLGGNGEAVRTRVLIVDDHPLMRRGLCELIGREPDLVVCGEAEDASTALEILKSANPQLMTVDISLKEGSGIELIKQLKASNPEISTLAFSMHDESLYAERAMRAGAKGYISKDAPSADVIAAIRRIRDGKIYMSERMADRVLRRVVDGKDAIDGSPVQILSDRELEVFELIGRGLGTRKIAEQLHLSVKTIETYRESIKAKLSLKSSTELTRHAVQWVLEAG